MKFFYGRGISSSNPTTSQQKAWTALANVERGVCKRGKMTIKTQLLKFWRKGFKSSITVTITLSLLPLMHTLSLASSNNSDDPPPKTTGISGASRG